jgi:hypothetical protein
MNLQERFEKGGYVLFAPKSGRVYAYGSDIEKMFKKIVKNKIPVNKKQVMFVPRKDVRYIV